MKEFETNERLNTIIKSAAEDAGIQGVLGEICPTESQKEVMNTDCETKVMHKVTAHALRHTFNKVMKKRDILLDARQHAMNHSDSSVTGEWYEENDAEYDDLIRKLFKFE